MLGLATALHEGRGVLEHVKSKPKSAPALAESAAFLAAHPGATAIAVEPQSLSVHTDAGLYWIACSSQPNFLPALLAHIRVQYFLLRAGEVSCKAFSGVEERLSLVESLAGGQMLVYRVPSSSQARRTSGSGARAPPLRPLREE